MEIGLIHQWNGNGGNFYIIAANPNDIWDIMLEGEAAVILEDDFVNLSDDAEDELCEELPYDLDVAADQEARKLYAAWRAKHGLE
jgi:hypothetical protein